MGRVILCNVVYFHSIFSQQQEDAKEHYEEHWETEWVEQDRAKQWERRAGTVGRERKRASVNDSGQRSKRARN